MRGLTVNRFGVYKIRIRISSCAIRFFNRKEINKSLDTKQEHLATSKAILLYNEYQKILKVIKMSVLTQEQIQELVDKFVIDTLNQDKLNRAVNGVGVGYAPADGYLFENDADASRDMLSGLIAEYKQSLAVSNYDDIVNTANQLLEPLGITINENEASNMLFLQQLLRGQIEVFNEAYDRYKGNFNPQYDTTATTEIKIKSQPIFTNNKALELFLKNYKATTTKGQYDEVANFMNAIFIHIVYKDEAIANTTLEDLLELREILLKLPKRNIQKYRDMTVEQLLECNPLENEIISTRTLNKYIKWLKMFYNFCMNNDYITKNPMVSLSTRTNGTDELTERLPLEPTEIQQLFSITSDNNNIINNGIKALAYSGMRLSEMYKAKTTIIDGISCFDLTDRAIKLKTRSSYRLIPIHSDINVELLSQLPTQDTFSKKVNQIIRDNISSDSKKVLYSLRHSFATTLKHNKIQPEVISELMGHSHQTMTLTRYADKYDVSTLNDAIKTISF